MENLTPLERTADKLWFYYPRRSLAGIVVPFLSLISVNKVCTKRATSAEAGRNPRTAQLASNYFTTKREHCPASLTPIEALTPLSCAELARTFVLWPRNLTRDLASTLAPLSLPCLHNTSCCSVGSCQESLMCKHAPSGAPCRTAGLVNHRKHPGHVCLLGCIFDVFDQLLLIPID